jgi:parallel beta-helix repeat protein
MRKGAIIISILSVLGLSITESLQAQSYYYVDTNKPTYGSGTINDPWNSIAAALYYAPAPDTADVIVYLRADTITLPADPNNYIYMGSGRSGNNGHYFTIKAYPNESVVIAGTNKATDFSTLLAIVDAQYIKIEDITFTDIKNISSYPVYIGGTSSNIQINNCRFTYLYWTTDLTEARYPHPTTSDYINPIFINGTSVTTAITNIQLNGNTFYNIAPGFGELIKKVGNWSNITEQNTVTDSIIRQGASSYFVSPSGNDTSGTGSINHPWKNVSTAVTQAGFDFSTSPATPMVDSNLTIYLRAGTYAEANPIYIGKFRGLNNKWFTIKNYNTDYVSVKGNSLTKKYAAIFFIDSAKYVRIEGLDINDLTNDTALTTVVNGVVLKDARYGIYIGGTSSNIEIKDNHIHNMKWTRDAVKAKNPKPNDVLSAISVVGGSNTPIRQLTIDNNTINDIVSGYAEGVAINGNVDTFTITNNEVYDIANIGIVAAGNYPWVLAAYPALSPANNQSRNGTIKNNNVYRCISPIAVSAGIYLDGSKNITVEGNDSYNNGTGISLGAEQNNGVASGYMVKSNDLYHNLFGGIFIGSNNKTSVVQNATVKWNSIYENFYIDSALYQRANGRYGTLTPAERGYEVYFNRANSISFIENEIKSYSNNVLAFPFSQSNLTLSYNLYYTTGNNACHAFFARDTTTNINDTTIGSGYGWVDVIDTSFHQYVSRTNYDLTSKLGDVPYNSNGCQNQGSRRAKDTLKEEIQAEIGAQTKVFPNPVTSNLNIKIYQGKSGIVNLKLSDISGRVLLQQTRKLNQGLSYIEWNNIKQHVAPGSFILQIISTTRNETFKIAIQ